MNNTFLGDNIAASKYALPSLFLCTAIQGSTNDARIFIWVRDALDCFPFNGLSSQVNLCLFFFSFFLLLLQKRVVFLSLGGFQAISLHLLL